MCRIVLRSLQMSSLGKCYSLWNTMLDVCLLCYSYAYSYDVRKVWCFDARYFLQLSWECYTRAELLTTRPDCWVIPIVSATPNITVGPPHNHGGRCSSIPFHSYLGPRS